MTSEKKYTLSCFRDLSKTVSMSESAMRHCQLLRTAMDFGKDEDEIIPVNVELELMQKVVAYCEHHADETPRDSDNLPIGTCAQSNQLPSASAAAAASNSAPAPTESVQPAALSTDISDWDRAFLGDSCPAIMALADAADYLGAFGLLHVCCKKMAQALHGKTDGEMRQILNVTLDVSKSEYERWLLENSWLEERK